jgi:hypothetical protein
MPYSGVFIYIAFLATIATIACLAFVTFVITSERRDKKDMREWRDKVAQGKHSSAEPKKDSEPKKDADPKKDVAQKKPRPDPAPKKEELVDPIKTDTTETAKMPTVSTGATAYVPPESDQKDVSAAAHRSNDPEVVTPVLNPTKPLAKKTAARKRAAKKVPPPKQP